MEKPKLSHSDLKHAAELVKSHELLMTKARAFLDAHKTPAYGNNPVGLLQMLLVDYAVGDLTDK